MSFKKKMYSLLSMVGGGNKSEYYSKYLRMCGIKVGKNVLFPSPRKTWIDTTRPDFLEIGDNCVITAGVTILAHDWSYSVLARTHKKIVGQQLWTKIGSNVFIGTNAIILMGSDIGDNVIIGAGSVVSGKVEANSLYVGNPAKRICSLDEYCAKCEKRFLEGAPKFIETFKEKTGRKPSIQEMNVYRPLFIEKDIATINKYYPGNGYFQEAVANMPLLYPDYSIED